MLARLHVMDSSALQTGQTSACIQKLKDNHQRIENKASSPPKDVVWLPAGALISATDPVATLSVFSQLDVPPLLYNIVFGESVLNDAVSVHHRPPWHFSVKQRRKAPWALH